MKRMKHDISNVINDAVLQAQTPGVCVLVNRNDEEVLFDKSGFSDIQNAQPVSRGNIYRLYSLTKPMTAVAAMTLIESGKLDIVAPVYEFLEGFKDQQVAVSDTQCEPVKRAVQVRDLFTMTSGLPYPGEMTPADRMMATLWHQMEQEVAQGQAITTVDMANRIGRSPLAHQPGEKWMYGTSADVLGAILEVVAGKPLNEYMDETVFRPLGMKDTGFFVPDAKRSRLVTLYEHKDSVLIPHKNQGLRGVFSLPQVLEGGASVYSTIDDVMTFGQMLLHGGKLKKERVISRNAVDWLSENHLNPHQLSFLNWDSVLGYGYGGLMRVMLSPGQSFSLGAKGEFGWDGWTGTYMSVCPEKNMVLTVMQQLAGAGTNAVIHKIRNVVYANI
ncbi:MAG TPA: serine hydrolase domain-containing protein [Candidatus Limiplasma sp.]|nr:serine hydrolase domain-containing protein [Candidatus Limiplasma sp.]